MKEIIHDPYPNVRVPFEGTFIRLHEAQAHLRERIVSFQINREDLNKIYENSMVATAPLALPIINSTLTTIQHGNADDVENNLKCTLTALGIISTASIIIGVGRYLKHSRKHSAVHGEDRFTQNVNSGKLKVKIPMFFSWQMTNKDMDEEPFSKN
jgi:hypothetical protein